MPQLEEASSRRGTVHPTHQQMVTAHIEQTFN
jgi:hypothetical protein